MKMGRNMKIEVQIIINLFFSSVLLKPYDILLDITYIHISYILFENKHISKVNCPH